MQFESIEQLIELTGINAKAAECLGASGALSNILPDLNELEAGQYTKEMVQYLREKKDYDEKKERFDERNTAALLKYSTDFSERQEKLAKKNNAYLERLEAWEKEVARREEINKEKKAKGQKELKIPPRPKKPHLKEIKKPNLTAPICPQKPEKPRIVLPQMDRLKNERDVLHIYISGHPLDLVPPKDGIDVISDVHLSKEEEFKRIRGVLQNILVTQTRSKNLMARLRIEDKTGSIEVVAFDRLYKSIRGSLIEGEIYEVLGKVSVAKSYSEDKDEEISYNTLKGLEVSQVKLGPTTEWEISYPALKGYIRVLPGPIQKNQGIAKSILIGLARGKIGKL